MSRYTGTVEREAYTRELVDWHLECLEFFRRSVLQGEYRGDEFLTMLSRSWDALKAARAWEPTVDNYLHLQEGMEKAEGGPTYMVWATAVEEAEERLRGLISV